jgi:hypothetical protein
MSSPLVTLLWYWGTTVLLAVLLFFPLTRLIWVVRVRRLERRLARKASEEERQGQLRSARIWAALIAVTFAFLYNRTLVIPG